MTERDRLKLLRFLSRSQTPLWLTETNQKQHSDLERAADWLASLGYSAKNGFSVHFRELEEEEMYEPTLVSLKEYLIFIPKMASFGSIMYVNRGYESRRLLLYTMLALLPADILFITINIYVEPGNLFRVSS